MVPIQKHQIFNNLSLKFLFQKVLGQKAAVVSEAALMCNIHPKSASEMAAYLFDPHEV
jgi:hypothetical protein